MILTVSDHAVTRYWERVKPTLLRDQAKAELEALAAASETEARRPAWLHPSGEPVDAFLHLSDGIVGLIVDDTLITVLVRGVAPESLKKARRERKARRRRTRRKPDIGFASGGSEQKARWR